MSTIYLPDGTPAAPSSQDVLNKLANTEGMLNMVGILRKFDNTLVYSLISVLDSRIFAQPDIDLVKVLAHWRKSSVEEAMLRAYCLEKGLDMDEGDQVPELDATHQAAFQDFTQRHAVAVPQAPQPFHKMIVIAPDDQPEEARDPASV